ncbi:hypothetical protein N7456_010116 [Penicillium angulare]|uniref:Uncharacterized protein n=1 Tax=Penicillium angulare TaxID=116970 RepID=A0A9W9F649_9EURO|nr:hypothetical protein N7456_010116 [Penicillium angulare]
MPSVSTLSQFTFSNWGPLTTTYTPPASCTTATNNVVLGITSYPGIEFMGVSCDTPDYGDCIPTGSSKSKSQASGYLDPRSLYQAGYFSPGIYCPSGWNTVGIASRDGNASVTSGGVFSPSTSVPTHVTRGERINNPANVLMQILDPSETAILCCPESMTGNTNLGCWSTLPDYPISTGCGCELDTDDFATVTETVWVDGKTAVWDDVLSLTATTPISHSLVETFASTDVSKIGLDAMNVVPMVTLVHKMSDIAGTGKDTIIHGTVGATSTATANSNGTGATSNAAVRMRSSRGVWDGLSGVLGVTVGGIILGAAIIFS